LFVTSRARSAVHFIFRERHCQTPDAAVILSIKNFEEF